MPKVVLQDNESQEQLLRRFRRTVMRSRVLTDLRRKRWFISSSELKRIQRKKAARRQRRAESQMS